MVFLALCQYIFLHFSTTPRILQPIILSLCGVVRDDTGAKGVVNREHEFIPMGVKKGYVPTEFNSHYETYKDPYYVTIIKTQLPPTSVDGFRREQKLLIYDTKNDVQKIYDILEDKGRNIVGMTFENGIVSWVEYKDWSNFLDKGYRKKICL